MSDGSLPISQVIRVLLAGGVKVYAQPEDPAKTVMTDGKDLTIVQEFRDYMSRRMVRALARKFDMPIHWFYNPNMVSSQPSASKPARPNLKLASVPRRKPEDTTN